MRLPMKELLMKWRTNDIKRCTAFLLVLLMLGIQVIDLPQVVFADGMSGDRWVSYRVDQVYDKDDKSLTITVDADEERSDVTIESMILPDGTVVHGNQAVYKVYRNGNYKFSVEYTVDAATATSSTAAGSTAAGSTIAGSTATGSTASPSEAAGKRKKRDIDVVVNAFPAVFAAGDVNIHDTANFPDLTFQGYLRSTWDKNKDGILSRDEQLAVSYIDIYSASLSDMGGLQFFPNLKSLHITAITRWNFKLDISQNTLLEDLRLYDVRMSSLDLSRNTNLSKVNLWHMGWLNQLDFRQNPRLAVVKLGDLGVSSLDFSQNPNLTSLNLRESRLNSLDISNNKKLNDLYIQDVNLPSLDISRNENLTDLRIESLMCNNTNVDTSQNPLLKTYMVSRRYGGNTPSSVDVSLNQNLEYLSLWKVPIDSMDMSNYPRLKSLTLREAGLTSVDVSKNPLLQGLYLDGNQLTRVDVSKNPLLGEISLSVNQLTRVDVSKNPLLARLYLSRNRLTNLDISNNPELTNLKVEENHLSTLDLTNNLKINRGATTLSNQTVEGVYHVKDSNYIVNFNEIIGSSNLGKIVSVSQNGSTIPYDPATGIAIAPMAPNKNVTYAYNTENRRVPFMNVSMSLQSGYLINAASGVGGSITPPGDTGVAAGGTQEYRIIPDAGYELDVLSVDGVTIGNTDQYTFRDVRADHRIEAAFKRNILPVVEYRITAASGAGGSITPPGEMVVAEGGTQEYRIIPDAGYELDVLSVDGVTIGNTDRYTFRDVRADHRIEAVFQVMTAPAAEYRITATAGAGGSITPPGEIIILGGGMQEYRITPDAGYELDVLSVDGVTIGNTDRYTFRDVRADHKIEAVFQVMTAPAAEYRITATAGAGGSITPPGETVVAEGRSQEYKITPDTGYELELLSVDGVTIRNTDRYVFLDVRADHRIEAVFKVMTAPDPTAEYRITATAGAGGSITPPGDTVVAEGGTQEYRITPDTGYELELLSVDGVTIRNTDRYVFLDVRADHKIEAAFKQKKAPVTNSSDSGGGITNDSHVYEPPTNSEVVPDILVKPLSVFWEKVWSEAKLVKIVPEEPALSEPALIETIPAQEVEAEVRMAKAREVKMAEALEEVMPVKPIENPVEKPEVEVVNGDLGERAKECHHLPLALSFLLICVAGFILIKRERDMISQMEAGDPSSGTTAL